MKKSRIDTGDFFKAIISLKTEKECEMFFVDISTIQEFVAIAQRFEVAKLLVEGKSYVDINKETGAIGTAEEHSVIGGLGSAGAECVAEEYPVPVVKLGVNDEFGHSGPAVKLLDEFGLRAVNIAEKVKKAISLKK